MSENVVSNIDIRVDDRDEEDFQVCYFRKRRRRCDATETTEIRDHNPRALNDDFVVDMFNCCVRRGNVGKPPHIFTLKNKLLQNVISSLVRLQLTASSELGKTVVAFLVNAQLELVKTSYHQLWRRTNDRNICWISSCLLAMMSEKESLVSLSTSLTTKLSARNLCQMLQDVLKPDNRNLLRLPRSVDIIRQMFNKLL